MVKLIWNILANGTFYEKDVREKMVITFLFILCMTLLFVMGEKALSTIGIVIGGFINFLKGSPFQQKPEPTTESVSTSIQSTSETKEEIKPKEAVIVESPKPIV